MKTGEILEPPDETSSPNVPFVRAIVTVYTILLLMILLGFSFIAGTAIAKLKCFFTAADPYERTYWLLNAIAHLLFACGALVLGCLALDSLLDERWKLSRWWPVISQNWYGTANHTILVLLDVLMILVISWGLMVAARYFGYLDENDRWRAPDWLLSKYRADEVMLEGGNASEPGLSSSCPDSGTAIESTRNEQP